MLYVGSDDGNLYALSGHPDHRFAKNGLKRFVYYEPDAKTYFRSGSDQRVKNYLVNCGVDRTGAPAKKCHAFVSCTKSFAVVT